MTIKICSKCKEEKDISNFVKDKNRKYGYYPQCKGCTKKYMEQYRIKNKGKIKEYAKQYYIENKEGIDNKNKEWQENNIEKVMNQRQRYHKKNKNKITERSKEWDKNNKERRRKQKQTYYKKPAKYNIYAIQLEWCEDVRGDPNNLSYLQVRCTESNCRKWFTPTNIQVVARIQSLNTPNKGMCNFYCSDNCKNKCSLYNQVKYRKDEKPYTPRPNQQEWRELILERDEYQCIKCGSEENLIAHHIEGLNQNPLMSADVDLGITLCKKCDKVVHSEVGCRPIDLTKENLCKRRNGVSTSIL